MTRSCSARRIIFVLLLAPAFVGGAATETSVPPDGLAYNPITEYIAVLERAATFESLVERTTPRFTWDAPQEPLGAHDLLWVLHNRAGKPIFAMNRAYRLRLAKDRPAESFLLGADAGAWSDWIDYAREVDEKPAVIARDPQRGVVYQAVWHSLPNTGTGHIEIERQVFLLCDGRHRWHLIGEGPCSKRGRNGLRAYGSIVDSQARWTDDPAAPVEVRCTERMTDYCIVEGNNASPVPDLETRHDATLKGTLPATLQWDDARYVVVEKPESLESLALRVAGWNTLYLEESDAESRRSRVRAVADLLRESNPGLPALIPAGTTVRFRPDIGSVAEARARHAR